MLLQPHSSQMMQLEEQLRRASLAEQQRRHGMPTPGSLPYPGQHISQLPGQLSGQLPGQLPGQPLPPQACLLMAQAA